MSELVLILILFPHSEFKCFKWFYMHKICGEYKSYFRKLPSYNRFNELMPKGMSVLSRLLNYLMYTFRRRESMGISYIDSTRLVPFTFRNLL